MLSLFFEVLLFSLSSLKSCFVLITSFFEPPQPILSFCLLTFFTGYCFKASIYFVPRSLTFDNRPQTFWCLRKLTPSQRILLPSWRVLVEWMWQGEAGAWYRGEDPGVTWIYQRVSAISYRGLEHSAVCRNSVETIFMPLRLTSGGMWKAHK